MDLNCHLYKFNDYDDDDVDDDDDVRIVGQVKTIAYYLSRSHHETVAMICL